MHIILLAMLSVAQAAAVETTSDTLSTEVRQSGDWQADLQAQVDLARQDEPEAVVAFASVAPIQNRAGQLFVITPDSEYRYALLADRLMNGDDPGEVRSALARQLAPVGKTQPELIVGLYELEQDPLVRASLLYGLRRVDADLALPLIAASLESSDNAERFEAAQLAGMHSEGGQLGAELVAVLGDSDPLVRKAAARSLGVHKVALAVEDLAPLLQDDSSAVRLATVNALERIDPTQAAALCAPMVNDTDPRVARAAKRLAP
jgi:HEAT repeat protein